MIPHIDLGDGKYADEHEGAVMITHGPNVVNLRTIEAEKLKRWLNENV